MFKTKMLVTFALAVAVAAPSWAQGQRRGFGFGGGELQLLQISEVQTELKLTDEQKGKVQPLAEENRAAIRELIQSLQGASQEERQKKLQDFQAETRKKVNAILNADQQKRLLQLVLQRSGPVIVLQREEIGKELKITDAQKSKITEIQREANEQRQALFQGGGGGGLSPEARAKLEEITKQTNEKITALLTEDQKAQWKKLCGDPFKFPERQAA